ncbi:MAG: peptidoglycan-binding protein [Acetobacteraceae bacterium]
MPYDAELLRAVAPRFSGENGARQKTIIDAVGAALDATLRTYAIKTDLRVAHFAAQICHEAAGLRTTEEFASGAAYEGRQDLGNTQPGDGPRYKGRGLIQLTGRANYRRYGAILELDLENDPEGAGEPVTSLRIACEYWKSKHLNFHADRDDVRTITQLINGGQNGFDDRKSFLAKAKSVLNVVPGALPPRPVLRRGDKNDDVTALQTRLRLAGEPVGTDGDFGGRTEAALQRFQQNKGLAATGVADAATWAALEAFV